MAGAGSWQPGGQTALRDGELLWQPSAAEVSRCELTCYTQWLQRERGVRCSDYTALHAWSVAEQAAFWRSLVDYFQVRLHTAERSVLSSAVMPGARWFDGATLNYAERALQHAPGALAVIACGEDGSREELSYGELRRRVACVARGLRELGVTRGDRVVGYLPNGLAALISFLACASLGAIWSSCPPEFGVQSVLDRFSQIEPRVLIGVSCYRYGGKLHDRSDALQRIVSGLPQLQATVLADAPPRSATLPGRVLQLQQLQQGEAEFTAQPVEFEHPLWILYSSGTTGLPKALVQGHGGIVLEHLKMLALHGDLRAGRRFFWFSTTGWMMWNYLVSGLLVGATIVLYDGNPGYPDLGVLWRLCAREQLHTFGVSAAFILACRKAGIRPSGLGDLSALRSVGSTGSPLPLEGFEWVYSEVKRDLLLASISGGTDLCTAFVGSCPVLPLYAGQLQCRALGAAVEAYDEQGRPVVGELGELVITKPMPSMPLYLWGDASGEQYRSSYFEMFPGVWRHGDWIRFDERGGAVIHGRSDSTLNRGGVRMGTSEFYRVVEGLPEVQDSLVVDSSELGQQGKLWLFVVLAPGITLDGNLREKIQRSLREHISPRHVPDELHAISEVPRTLSGKKLEVPLKRMLSGVPLQQAVNPGTLKSPQALDEVLRVLALPV
jgi:acetoacetyl-CoA synthetase